MGGSATSSSAMRPSGSDGACQLGEERRQVDQVPQGEPARRTVDALVGDGEPQHVGVDERCGRAGGRQHPERQVHPDRSKPRGGELTAQVARATGQVDHGRAVGEGEVAHGPSAPGDVHPQRHDPVHEVVPGGDGVEHRPHGPDLVGALRKVVGVDHRRGQGHGGDARSPPGRTPIRARPAANAAGRPVLRATRTAARSPQHEEPRTRTAAGNRLGVLAANVCSKYHGVSFAPELGSAFLSHPLHRVIGTGSLR